MNDEEIDAVIKRVSRRNGAAMGPHHDAQRAGFSREQILAVMLDALAKNNDAMARQWLHMVETSEPPATLGGNLASAVATGSNRAVEPETPEAVRERLIRAAARFALDLEPEAARACLDVATFIQLNGI